MYQLLISWKSIKNKVKENTDKFYIFNLPSLHSIWRLLPSRLNLKYFFYSGVVYWHKLLFLCVAACSFLSTVSLGTESTCWFEVLCETAVMPFVGNGSLWLILRAFIFQKDVSGLLAIRIYGYCLVSPEPLIFFSCCFFVCIWSFIYSFSIKVFNRINWFF